MTNGKIIMTNNISEFSNKQKIAIVQLADQGYVNVKNIDFISCFTSDENSMVYSFSFYLSFDKTPFKYTSSSKSQAENLYDQLINTWKNYHDE